MGGYARLSTGVELNGARHAFATELAQSALPGEMPQVAKHVDASPAQALASGLQLLHGNMLNANLTSATVLYMNPACLSCSTKRQLVQKILQECPNLQFILTTYPLSGIADSDEFTELQTEFLSPMIGYEWQIPVGFYKRSGGVSTPSSSTAWVRASIFAAGRMTSPARSRCSVIMYKEEKPASIAVLSFTHVQGEACF